MPRKRAAERLWQVATHLRAVQPTGPSALSRQNRTAFAKLRSKSGMKLAAAIAVFVPDWHIYWAPAGLSMQLWPCATSRRANVCSFESIQTHAYYHQRPTHCAWKCKYDDVSVHYRIYDCRTCAHCSGLQAVHATFEMPALLQQQHVGLL